VECNILLQLSEVEKWTQEIAYNLLENIEVTCRQINMGYLQESLNQRISKGVTYVDMKNLKLHVHHSLNNSDFDDLVKKLMESQDLMKRFERVGHDIAIPIPPTPTRHRDYLVPFDSNAFVREKNEIGTVLNDFEKSISYWESINLNWKYVWTVFNKYLETAREFYTNDPVGTSRMILTLLKVIKIWDKAVCLKFPILLQHRAGVDLSVCQDLILPIKGDLESLSQVEGYIFRQ